MNHARRDLCGGVRSNAYPYRDRPLAQTCCKRRSKATGFCNDDCRAFALCSQPVSKRSFLHVGRPGQNTSNLLLKKDYCDCLFTGNRFAQQALPYDC